MYLSARVLGEVIARFARALAPDGFLFLSHAEPLRGISQAFQVEHCAGAFYYVLRNASESPAGWLGRMAGSSRQWTRALDHRARIGWPPRN